MLEILKTCSVLQTSSKNSKEKTSFTQYLLQPGKHTITRQKTKSLYIKLITQTYN